MDLIKTQYNSLNSKQKENYNFHQVASILATYGFNSLRLNDDWQGADFLAYHINGTDTLRIQLKARIAIDQKYKNKGIHIAFPFKEHWYLIDHDELIEKVRSYTNWLNTKSWKNKGNYHSRSIKLELLKAIDAHQLDIDKHQQTVAETE